MNFIDNLLGKRTESQPTPKIDPKSKARVDNELKVANFSGTDEDRIALAKTLNINPAEIPEIMRSYQLRTDLNAAHVSAQNAARDRMHANNAARVNNPLHKQRPTTRK